MTEQTKKKAAKAPQPTWEDRVVAAETNLEASKAHATKLEAALADSGARIAALEAAANAYKQAEAARKAQADEAYVAGIQERATALQSPIAAEDLERVKAALARGDSETAKALGDAYLALSEARTGSSEARDVQLGKSAGAEADEAAEFTAGLLRDVGLKASVEGGQVVTTPNRIAV